jgi:3D-(3,5/4)-trihydroxycyclohexane-1,2-dione acylhydrolase (decyclizing)
MSAMQDLSRAEGIAARAGFIARAGGVGPALASGRWPAQMPATLAEALVLGLLERGVRKHLAIFGHGSTALAEVLRIYDGAGVTRTFDFRHEVEMAHAATALRRQYVAKTLVSSTTRISGGAVLS